MITQHRTVPPPQDKKQAQRHNKKSPVALNTEFGEKVFDPKTNRWVRREEMRAQQSIQAAKDPKLVRLEQLEKDVNVNFLAAAEALREIKENKLYLLVTDTWESYCRERLGRGIEAIRLQIKALEIAEKSHLVGLPILNTKDLREKARGVSMEITTVKSDPAANKQESKKTAVLKRTKAQAIKLDVEQITEQETLYREIISLINRARGSEKFLRLLKEWLVESVTLLDEVR